MYRASVVFATASRTAAAQATASGLAPDASSQGRRSWS